jgi:ankyrin repeat protein
MYAVRNGHEAVARTLAQRGADLNVTNGDGVTALIVAIVNDRFDLAGTLVDLGANVNDGSLYFAVDMHDATTDMRAHDGSRLRADHPNTMSSLDLIAKLLDRGADPTRHSPASCIQRRCAAGDDINASPFYRAAVAADVEALKLLIAHGADVEWSPKPVKKTAAMKIRVGDAATPTSGERQVFVAINGGRGAAFAAGPGFDRLGPPPFREASNREPCGGGQSAARGRRESESSRSRTDRRRCTRP